MRREASIDPCYFEALYRVCRDPWGFETSAYEAAKYARTLEVLPDPPGALLEVGCSIGVLTAQLAPRCAQLLALDVSETALGIAAQRCVAFPNTTFAQMRVPQQLPRGRFDTVLLSEVVYYWDSADVAHVAEWLPRALTDHGHVLLVHWTGLTDYPKSGDEAVENLRAGLGSSVVVAREERTDDYRLDVWRRA